jgi:hypothetical protein
LNGVMKSEKTRWPIKALMNINSKELNDTTMSTAIEKDVFIAKS